jgi:DNA-binding PadR family transcriptional regulator
MFFRHFHQHEAHRRCGPGGEGSSGFGRFRRGGGGFGGREGRMFNGGELRLIILALIAEKPRHGYEVIKALGERAGGDYSPSPGVVYPTLTLLDDTGLASARADEAGRKLYAVTPEGQKLLDDSKEQIDAIFTRLDGESGPGWAEAASVLRAMMNLRASVKLRLRGRKATKEQIQAIADALDAAAKTIEKI